jgi:UbiD family decarboxylase
MKKDITSLRSTLEFLDATGELVTTGAEVDPHLQVAAIQKHLDGGAALLFDRVKGYPNARICNNVFASAERIARLFDVDDAPQEGCARSALVYGIDTVASGAIGGIVASHAA